MTATDIHSPAFHSAELRSERVRLYGLLAFLGAVFTVLLIRLFLLHTTVFNSHAAWTLAMILATAALEFAMLRMVERAIRNAYNVPGPFWIVTTLVESTLPAVGVAFLNPGGIPEAYQPIASPAFLLYFVFIILSILRLNPRICWLAGAVATSSYLLAALHLGWRPPVIGEPAPVEQTDVALYAMTLLIAGFVAAGVAKEIRKHVQAALTEAETKQRLERLQHDLKTARDIQQSLLPQEAPSFPGYSIAGWNQPADDTGGDYYDWSVLPDGRLIVTLADVTGHGIGPALLAAACRAYSRTNFLAHHDVYQAFHAINASIARDLDPTRFVTYAGVACHPATGELEILSAGHGPLYLYSAAADAFAEIDSHGVPLGILPEFTSGPSTRVQMQPGDLFLLITDGFIEWENAKAEQFGSARLREAVRAARSQDAESIIKALYAAVDKFAGGTPQQDDLTAVIIKRI